MSVCLPGLSVCAYVRESLCECLHARECVYVWECVCECVCISPLSGGSRYATTSRGHHDSVPLLRQGQTPLKQLGLSLHVIFGLLWRGAVQEEEGGERDI